MKTAIVFFSLTGNNKALAESVAKAINADIIEVSTKKKFGMGTLTGDIMFKRTPKVTPEPETLNSYENILFMGPMWLGQVATPLRAYFKNIRQTGQKYSIISVCGGAKGGNGNLSSQLEARVGRAPENALELHTAGLVPEEVNEDIKVTSEYLLTVEDVKAFTQKAIESLG